MNTITNAQWKDLFGRLNVDNLKQIESLIAQIIVSKQLKRQHQEQPEKVLTEAELVKIIESRRVTTSNKEAKSIKRKKANLNNKNE